MADFLRKNAADKIATYEYKWILLAIIVVVAWANYYFLVIVFQKSMIKPRVSLDVGSS